MHITLDDIVIPFHDIIPYLGIHFNKLMKANNHAKTALQKSKRIASMFSGLMNNKHLPQNTKLQLYKVVIRPVLIYGFPIWFSISPTARDLKIFERKILRKCVGKIYENFVKRFHNLFIYKLAEVVLCRKAMTQQINL